ncbi:transposase [Streptococcus pneumoniae]|nr:transposase [Streptococcus pneumoniae]
MKKQVFHDAAAGVLIGLILSILFSLIYAPNTYAPLNPYSLIGQVMDQHQVHGALVLLYCTLIWAAIGDKSSLGAKGLAYCDQLFSLERDWEALPADKRLQKRQEELQPLIEDFFAWCRRQSVLAGSKLGRAIEYSLKYEETFKTILKDGHLVLSNNLAECAIKSLVMGRSKRVQWTLLA